MYQGCRGINFWDRNSKVDDALETCNVTTRDYFAICILNANNSYEHVQAFKKQRPAAVNIHTNDLTFQNFKIKNKIGK